MFKKNTVVVVGAGASFEAGLPIGAKLKEEISNLTRYSFNYSGLESGNGEFYSQLARMPEFSQDHRRIRQACAKISNGIGYVSSIDSFLEIHAKDPDIQVCAKSAIVRIIAAHERGSKLNFDRGNIYNRLDTGGLQATWYLELAHLLFEKVDASSLARAFEPVSFISFNYDRCLEWFVFNALKGLYSLEDAAAQRAIEGLRVLHPYGYIGPPRWLSASSGVDFGDELNGRLGHAAKSVRTFTESADAEAIAQIKKAAANATTIVFLGFAFHPQNIELLRPQELSNVSHIYGTSHGMSEPDRAEVEGSLKRSFTRKRGSKDIGPDVQLSNLKCAEFMSQFRRTLAVT
jgi:hypothetical protein